MPGERLGGANEQVEREAAFFDRLVDAHGLLNLIARRHDHQQIHVAVGRRSTGGVRTEEDYLVGLETFHNLPGKILYCRYGSQAGIKYPARTIYSDDICSFPHSAIVAELGISNPFVEIC
jgi:hypothetical protein